MKHIDKSELIEYFEETKSIRSCAKKFKISWQRVVKILATENIEINRTYSDVTYLYSRGLTINSIAETLKISPETVAVYLPRKRPEYGVNQSENALKIKRSRDKKMNGVS